LYRKKKRRREMKRSYILLGIFLLSLNIKCGGYVGARSRKEVKVNPSKDIIRGLPSFAAIVKKLSPAVVSLTTIVKKGRPRFGPGTPFYEFFERFFGEEFPREFRGKGIGSGFIITKDGYILTNHHVVENAETIKVRMIGDKEFSAKIVGLDPRTDIALIKIKSKGVFPTVKLGNSDKLQIGDWVIAIGNPFGLEHTVTVGIVSAKQRYGLNPSGRRGYYNFIQTDASINPGNSGGPLFNIKGEVVGINTAIKVGGPGIGFAVPINMAKALIPMLKKYGRVKRSWLGVYIQYVTRELAESIGLKKPRGALVSEVIPHSPASRAGIKRGDVILSFNGKKIHNHNQLSWIVSITGIGKKAKVEVFRKGKKKIIYVTLGEMPEDRELSYYPYKEKTLGGLGIKVENVREDLRQRLGLKEKRGVVIVWIDPDGLAAQAGLERGDVILEINYHKIYNVHDFYRIWKSIPKGKIARFFVKREYGSIFIAFRK
jgi:serine protease Do